MVVAPHPHHDVTTFTTTTTTTTATTTTTQPPLAKRVLSRLNMWGMNHEDGYRKKAKCDVVVPAELYKMKYTTLKKKYR